MNHSALQRLHRSHDDLKNASSSIRRTTGTIPPPRVGCSTTLIGDVIYIFGGRLNSTRTMTSTLYALSLTTLHWTLLWPPPTSSSSPAPTPRYFHSGDAWGDKLVVFGGEGFHDGGAGGVAGMRALDDLWVWDTLEGRWERPETTGQRPGARFAHLSIVPPSVGSGKLFVLGGQESGDMKYLKEMAVLDLGRMEWDKAELATSVGSYRSAAAAAGMSVVGAGDGVVQMGYSRIAEEGDEPVMVFSNADVRSDPAKVRRDFDFINTTSLQSVISHTHRFTTPLPPGLRFPSAARIGRFYLLYGVHITRDDAGFVVWALDLGANGSGETMTWKRVELGEQLKTGSWSRAVVKGSQLMILGNAAGNAAADYGQRQLSFSHLAIVNLESFGIYQPPLQPLSIPEQALALKSLSTPSSLSFSSFHLLSSDGKTFPCSRRLVSDRWELVASELEGLANDSDDEGASVGAVRVFADRVELPLKSGPTLALLQYFATLFLSTRLQLSFSVLGALLGFAGLHPDLAHLRNLCVHALHEGLEDGAYPSEGVYQLAREEGCEGLRVRSGRMLSRDREEELSLVVPGRESSYSSGSTGSVARSNGGSSSQGTSNYGASNYDPGSPPDSQLSLPTPYDRRPSLPPRSSTHSSSSTSGALCDFSSPSRPPYRSRHGSEPPADRLLSDGSERTVASWSSHTSLMSTVVEPSHAHIVSIPERAEPLFIFEEAGFSVPSERMRRPLSPPLPSRPISPPYSFARTEPTLLPAIPHPSPIDERVFPNLPPKDETVTHSSASTITPTPLPSPPSPPPAPYEAPQGPLPPPLVQASKHLSTSLPCPPKLAFMPGGTLSLTLENLANVPLRNAFSAITIHGIGISLLQGGNLLPSRHVILDQKLDVDLFRSGETSSMVVDFVLPDEVECKCRREGTVLPASAAVRLGSALGSSAAEGSGILIGYKLEITGKRKGWQKRTEKITLAFPVGALNPLGIIPHFPSLELALESLPASGWKSSEPSVLSMGGPSQGSLVAELAYWSATCPESVLVAWRAVFRTSQADVDKLVELLRADVLDVSIGRRAVPLFGDKQGGGEGSSRTFKIDVSPNSCGVGVPSIEPAGDFVNVRVAGWIDIGMDDMELPRSCNGELRHYLVAALTTPASAEPLSIEMELHPFALPGSSGSGFVQSSSSGSTVANLLAAGGIERRLSMSSGSPSTPLLERGAGHSSAPSVNSSRSSQTSKPQVMAANFPSRKPSIDESRTNMSPFSSKKRS